MFSHITFSTVGPYDSTFSFTLMWEAVAECERGFLVIGMRAQSFEAMPILMQCSATHNLASNYAALS